MRHKDECGPVTAEKTVRDIRRATRRRFSAEEKIRIVLEGLRGEEPARSSRGAMLVWSCLESEIPGASAAMLLTPMGDVRFGSQADI